MVFDTLWALLYVSSLGLLLMSRVRELDEFDLESAFLFMTIMVGTWWASQMVAGGTIWWTAK